MQVMVNFIGQKGHGPIGIELGPGAVQMMQCTADRKRLVEAVRWDLPRSTALGSPQERRQALVEAIHQARQGRKFRGRNVVACLSARELFVQNIRVAKGPLAELPKIVQQEAASRLPFPPGEADLRFLSAGEVRQGDQTRREVILMACHGPVVAELLSMLDEAGLRAVALDVEPAALLRAYGKQLRRDDDKARRVMFARVGSFNTTVVIAQGTDACFVKYVDVGGDQLDQAVADHLKISPEEAATLRANNGDRRTDQQDPEITASVSEATRGVIERLVGELALCTRYHSVTFRGQAIDRLILGGGEATQGLADIIGQRLDMKCEVGDPLRSFDAPLPARRAQWDVTTGLALREVAN
jgi:type IV pilus assembly protein PilM